MCGRCRSCDCVLSDDEMVNKWPGTLEYTDLCFTCLSMCSDDSEWEDFDLDHISIDELPESLE